MYDHNSFRDTMDSRISEIAMEVVKQAPDEACRIVLPALHLLGGAFAIGHEIVGNLNMIVGQMSEANRLAAERLAMDKQDMQTYIQQQINDGVEKALATRQKRSYIGQHQQGNTTEGTET